ncbi:hypothetical protein AB0J38_13925 [Streptomyces sp. NPDC050095]|uniref:hypothetical protein n=1 Tax=unclassified Streptomyces TaxID=2593676 RepID=UPI0034265FB3
MPPTLRRLPRAALPLLPLLVLAASFAAQAVGALLPHTPLLIAATLLGYAVEAVLYRWQLRAVAALSKVRADVTMRQVLRDFLLVAGLLRIDEVDQRTFYLPLVCGLLLFYTFHFACHAAAILVRRTRTLPFVTRNIDASGLRLSPAPPALLLRRPAHRVLAFSLPADLGLMLTAATDVPKYAAAGIALSIALSAVGLGELVVRLLPRRRPVGEAAAMEWLDAWLAEYRPTVGMYFSGGSSSAYQANMWLRPLAELGERPLIVLRERAMVQRIGATDIPILCLPKVATLMHLEQSTLKVLLHPSNSGKTSQVLRIPTIKHAFVNHGESDKLSSCNPFAKAYDEVWVAGRTARERYAQADVGVEDHDIVEVGRPQLAGIRPDAAHAGERTTVLYAPTWEGWDGNPGNTSVIEAGENVVRTLLADPAVRLLYKPHPMTGSVDPRAGAANARIQEMIRAANEGRPSVPESDQQLALKDRELTALTDTSFRSAADECERMMVQGTPVAGRAEAVETSVDGWEDAYWAALPPSRHRIVTGARPGIYSCFNQADLLISDVSSVISDYLASGKPYAVVNTSGVTEDEFRQLFSTVRAATILTPDAAGLPALLASVRAPGADEALAADRSRLREELLGPVEPASIVRFRGAVRALVAAAEAHNERAAAETANAIPSQRRAEVQTPIA